MKVSRKIHAIGQRKKLMQKSEEETPRRYKYGACCDAKRYITPASILERVISTINFQGPNSPGEPRHDTRIFAARTCRGPWKITRSHLSFRGRKAWALPSSKFRSALFSPHSDSSPATRASANGRWRVKKKGERKKEKECEKRGKKRVARMHPNDTRHISLECSMHSWHTC